MSTPENQAALVKVRDELSVEHASIRRIVDQLRQPQAAPADALALLEELHGSLKEHFAHEEYPGGFYEALGACTLEHSAELRGLVDQHFLLLSTAQSLKERARAATAPSAAFDVDLAALVERLAAHERREHELVARFVH